MCAAAIEIGAVPDDEQVAFPSGLESFSRQVCLRKGIVIGSIRAALDSGNITVDDIDDGRLESLMTLMTRRTELGIWNDTNVEYMVPRPHWC